jgi:nucleoside-diphosphate-sugar epimerase
VAILITGGTGFIGSYLARKLVHAVEDKVVLFDLFPNPSSVEDIRERIDIVQGDFAESIELMQVIRKYDISDVFHLGYAFSDADPCPIRSIRTNCVGTTSLFEIARSASVRRVIWASSGAISEQIKTSDQVTLIDENITPTPNLVYGACKIFNEHIAEIFHERYGFDHICLRIASVYGLGRAERGKTKHHDIFTIVEQAAQGKPILLPPENHLVPWSYVEDAAQALYVAYKAAKPQHRILNFAGEIRPVKDAADCLRAIFNDVKITLEPQGVHAGAYLKADLIQEEIGFIPEYSMENGMKDYADRVFRSQKRND